MGVKVTPEAQSPCHFPPDTVFTPFLKVIVSIIAALLASYRTHSLLGDSVESQCISLGGGG